VILRYMLESSHRGAPSSLMTPDHTTRTVTLIVRGGCELKDAAKASSFSVAGYKRGRDQATSRVKASSQGLNPKMTLVAQRKMRKASSLLLFREGNAAIGYPYKEYKLQPTWATELIVSWGSDIDNLPTEDLALASLKK